MRYVVTKMPYIKNFDCNQMMRYASDSFVESDSDAKLVGAFVDGIDLKFYGVKTVSLRERPIYDPEVS